MDGKWHPLSYPKLIDVAELSPCWLKGDRAEPCLRVLSAGDSHGEVTRQVASKAQLRHGLQRGARAISEPGREFGED